MSDYIWYLGGPEKGRVMELEDSSDHKTEIVISVYGGDSVTFLVQGVNDDSEVC